MEANLELSKQLFEVSGWGYNETDKVWCHGKLKNKGMVDTREVHEHFPAYSLSFLIRKLPAAIDNHNLILCTDGTGVLEEIYWCAYYDAEPVQFKSYANDAPETALCNLALALFEAGILTREGEDDG